MQLLALRDVEVEPEDNDTEADESDGADVVEYAELQEHQADAYISNQFQDCSVSSPPTPASAGVSMPEHQQSCRPAEHQQRLLQVQAPVVDNSIVSKIDGLQKQILLQSQTIASMSNQLEKLSLTTGSASGQSGHCFQPSPHEGERFSPRTMTELLQHEHLALNTCSDGNDAIFYCIPCFKMVSESRPLSRKFNVEDIHRLL
jgi:hypothetical protein